MLPSWAHAYSHRMMKSYQCDTSQNPKVNRDIRNSLNEKIIKFDGEVAFTEDDELPYTRAELPYTRAQIACALWNSRLSRKSTIIITFQIELTRYRYENTDEIKFLKKDTHVDKTTWFDEVFPKFGKDDEPEPVVEEPEPAIDRTVDLYNLMNPRHLKPPSERPSFNLDNINSLKLKDRGIICYIFDNIGSPEGIEVTFDGGIIRVTDSDYDWLYQFALFWFKYEESRNEKEMWEWFDRSDERTKRLILQIPEFKEILDPGEEKVGEPNDLTIPPRVQELLVSDQPVVTCLDSENGPQSSRSFREVSNTTVTLVRGTYKSTVIRPSPNLDAVLATVVPADEEFTFGGTPPSVNWETVEDTIRCSNECVKVVDTDPAEYSQSLTEFVPQPENAKEWKRMKYKKKDGSVGNGFLADPHQMHSIIYGGSKLLIAHRPGFGKTINSILHAEKLRNSCTGPKPKILILAPSRKLLMHWIRELDRLEMDKSHYIWSTYKHFMYTQTRYLSKNSTGTYPEYHLLSEKVRDELDKLLQKENYHLDGEETDLGLNLVLKSKPEVTRVGQRNYGDNKNHCMRCGKGVKLKECKDYVNYDELKRMWRFDSKECVTHHLHLTSSRMIKIQFMWRKHEDKIFFTCKDHGSRFITGFQCKDINPKTFTELEEQVSAGNEDLQTVEKYIENERAAYGEYLQELRGISGMSDASAVEIKKALNKQTGELGLSYFVDSANEIYHMYRAPDDCILIADEVHTQVKNKHNNVMDCLWKYCLNSRFTILASATPIESNEETKQMYLLSEMLRTNREYDDKVFPPWHPLRVWDTNKDIFTLSAGLKSKISRLNTVEDIEKAVDFFVKGEVEVNEQTKLYDLDPTNIMNLFLGISGKPNALKNETMFISGKRSWKTLAEVPEDKRGKIKSKTYLHWLGTEDADASETQIRGENPYAFVQGDLLEYRNTAMKTLYRKRQLDDTKPKLFPDKVAYKDGYIKVPNDEIRLSMMLRSPIPELRFELPNNEDKIYNVKVSENTITVTKSDDGTYTGAQILDLQQLCFSNSLPGLVAMVYQKPDQKRLPNRVVCANYLVSTNTRSYMKTTTSDKVYTDLKDKLKPDTMLKWLNVCPAEKQRGQGGDKKEAEVHYNNIPFLPGLVSSKMMAIVETIEQAYKEGKNVMVYHPRVEIHRAVQRVLAMRGHVSANAYVESNSPDLIEHQKLSAIKRWAIVDDDDTIEKQMKKYKIYESLEEVKELIKPYRLMMDWEVIYKTIEGWKDRSIWKIYFNVGPSKYNALSGKQSLLSKLKLFNEVFRYFEYEEKGFDGDRKNTFDSLIDDTLKVESIPKKVNRSRREEIRGAMDNYSHLKKQQFEGYENKIFLECERYFKYAIQKIVSKQTKKKKDKEITDWQVDNLKLRSYVSEEFKVTVGGVKEVKLADSTFDLTPVLNEWKHNKYSNRSVPDLPFGEIKAFLTKHKAFFEQEYFKEGTSKLTFNRVRLISEIKNDDPMHMNMNDSRIGEIGGGYDVGSSFIEKNPFTTDIETNEQVITLWCYVKGFFQMDYYKNFGQYGNLFPDIWEGANGKIVYTSKTTKDQLELEAARRGIRGGTGVLRRLNELRPVTGKAPRGEITLEEYNMRLERLKQNPYRGKIKTKGMPSLRLNYKYYVIDEENKKHRQWYDKWENQQLLERPGLNRVQRLGIGGDDITKSDFFDTMSSRITGLHQRWNNEENKLFYGVLTGDVSKKNYDAFVDAFSTGKIDCLFVSDAGIEGIDYKSPAPSLMISIDPVKSPGKMDQFTGRTIRRNSHQTLPKDMRVTEYVSFCTKKYEVEDNRKQEYIGEDVTAERIKNMVLTYRLAFTKKYKEENNIIETGLTDDQKEELKKIITDGIKDLEDLIKGEKENPTGEAIDLRSTKFSAEKVNKFLSQSQNKLPKGARTRQYTGKPDKWKGKLLVEYNEWYETQDKGPLNRVDSSKIKEWKDKIAEKRKEIRRAYFESIGGRLGEMTEEEKKVFNKDLNDDDKYSALTRRYNEVKEQEEKDNADSKDVQELTKANENLTKALGEGDSPDELISEIIELREKLNYSEMTANQIKKDRDPNNPKTMNEYDIATEIQRIERVILNGKSNSQKIKRINQLGKELADRDDKTWNKRTSRDYTDGTRTKQNVSDPYDAEDIDIDMEDEDDENKFEKIEYPENKKWNHYIDNYVNISHVPVHNNIAFLSVGDYEQYMKDIAVEEEKIKDIPERITRSSVFTGMNEESLYEIRKTSEKARKKLELFDFRNKFFCHACNWFSGGVTMEDRKKAYEEHQPTEPLKYVGLDEPNEEYTVWSATNERLKKEYAKEDRCERCNTKLTLWDGKKQNILYYHLMKPRKGIFDDKEKVYKNETHKELANKKRVQRDRLEMALAMNSVEHQARNIGRKVFKFSSVDGGWEKNFYKAVNKEGFDLTEEQRQKSWHSFIEYSAINDPEPEPEPIKVKLMSGQDFRDMVESSNPSAPEAPSEAPSVRRGVRRGERKTYFDDIEEGQEVYFRNKLYTVEEIDGDNITLNDGRVVNKKDLDNKEEGTAFSESESDEGNEKQVEAILENDEIVKAILENDEMSPETKYAALIAIGYDPGTQLGGNSINLNQYVRKDVVGDGDCMYHSIIAATRHIGVAPGNDEKMTPTKLRRELINGINGMGDCIDLINEIDELDDVTLNNLKDRIENNGWGGALECRVIQCLYKVPITIVAQNTGQIVNFVDIVNGGIVLIYSGNHYNWLCLKPCTESPSLSTEEYLSDASIQSEY